jgi:hypothetical protein
MLRRSALILALAGAARAQCGPFGVGADCPVDQHNPSVTSQNANRTIGVGEAYVFKADVTGLGTRGGDTLRACGTCPASGHQLCDINAKACPSGCHCSTGNKLIFRVGSPKTTKGLVFAVSDTVPASSVAQTAKTGFFDGDWTISGKQFNTEHKHNIGKGHASETFDMVELCYPAWKKQTSGGGSFAAKFADAECGCEDCEDACGLRGSRKATSCDDQSCYSSEGELSCKDTCIQQGRSAATCTTAYDRCDGGMCNDQYSMQIRCSAKCGPPDDEGEPSLPANNFNCTAYAASPLMSKAAMFANYCCDMTPKAFLDAIPGLITGPNKKSGAFFPTGKNSSSGEPFSTRCNTNVSQPDYGYEIAFDPAAPSVVNCQLPSGAGSDTGTYYLYVLNTGTSNVTLTDLTWDVKALTPEDGEDCAAVHAPPVSSGAGRVSVVLVSLAALVAVWL